MNLEFLTFLVSIFTIAINILCKEYMDKKIEKKRVTMIGKYDDLKYLVYDKPVDSLPLNPKLCYINVNYSRKPNYFKLVLALTISNITTFILSIFSIYFNSDKVIVVISAINFYLSYENYYKFYDFREDMWSPFYYYIECHDDFNEREFNNLVQKIWPLFGDEMGFHDFMSYSHHKDTPQDIVDDMLWREYRLHDNFVPEFTRRGQMKMVCTIVENSDTDITITSTIPKDEK